MILARRGKTFDLALATLEKIEVQFVCATAEISSMKPKSKAKPKIRLNNFIVNLDCGKANAFKAIQFLRARLPNSASNGIFIAMKKLGIVAKITQTKKCL